MILEIQSPYTEMINNLINYGIANNPEEVVRQSLLAFSKQFEFEEIYLVNKGVETETDKILKNDLNLTDAQDVFDIAGV